VKQEEKTFRLHWGFGKTQDVSGRTISEAMALAGYSAGAIWSLDYYEELPHRELSKENQ
jgi:hypothetical protein